MSVIGGGVLGSKRRKLQNLLRYSEDYAQSFWFRGGLSVAGDLLTLTAAAHSLRAQLAVTPGQTYTLAFDVKRGTATELKWSVYNFTASTNIVAPTSYYAQTSGEYIRLSFSFTVPAGCISIYVYPLRDSGVTGTVYINRVQLNEGAGALPYTKTEAQPKN